MKLYNIDYIPGKEITALEEIPAGHKIAITDIGRGENVVKYGYAIGHATSDIKAGAWVHTHDTKTNLEGILEYKYEPDSSYIQEKKSLMVSRKGTFKGFLRDNGKVGIRNEVWIIPTVGCVNNIATAMAKQAKALLMRLWPLLIIMDVLRLAMIRSIPELSWLILLTIQMLAVYWCWALGAKIVISMCLSLT